MGYNEEIAYENRKVLTLSYSIGTHPDDLLNQYVPEPLEKHVKCFVNNQPVDEI